MKLKVLLLIILLLNLNLIVNGKEDIKMVKASESSITVKSTPELFPTVLKWANVFNDSETATIVNVESTEIISPELMMIENEIRFLMENDLTKLRDDNLWKMVIGRDVIVPIINSGNPFYKQLLLQGVSAINLNQLLSSSENQNWEILLGDKSSAPVKVYAKADENINTTIKNFLDIDNPSIIEIENIDDLLFAIQNDKTAIGFCRLTSVVIPDNQRFVENIALLPIDANGSGVLEKIENIYTDPNFFLRGVWIGKYPKSLFQNIYIVSNTAPSQENNVNFLKWIVSNGSQTLSLDGFAGLVNNEKYSKLSKLNPLVVKPTVTDKPFINIRTIMIFIGLFILAFFLIDLLIRQSKTNNLIIEKEQSNYSLAFDENSIEIPKGIYFDKTHTWAFMEKEGNVRIGIDDFLQHVTGTFSRVIMKDEGTIVKKCEPILTLIQSGKQIDICTPVSGTIKAYNTELLSDVTKLNTSPFDKGWVYLIEPSNWKREAEFLYMASKYKTWIKLELNRLKDFLANLVSVQNNDHAPVVLQDGGEVVDNVLSKLGPNVWEEFQSDFLNNSF